MIQALTKKYPYGFLIAIFFVISVLYIIFVKLLIIDLKLWPTFGTILFLIIFHIILIFLIWSLIIAFRQDPGHVPSQWGFAIDNRNKKYCLICHVFKPQRTHHCSACNRCVLNMDHHCPWINSCIGFYNRKAFILMLIYTNIITFLNIIAFLTSISGLFGKFSNVQAGYIIRFLFICLAFIFNCIIFVTIVLFLKFHLELIFSNMTTLQTLQLKRQNKDPQLTKSPYNIGSYYNWVQVFGKNSLTWPIPIFLQNEGPSGDGVLWPKNE